jgi:uncharacterized protein YhaN
LDIRKELERKIERKRDEIQQLEESIREAQMKLNAAEAYIAGMAESLKLLPKGTVANAVAALRPNSVVARAREAILAAGKPLHISELLKALDRPVTHNTRAALSGSLASYVRKGEIFTRPAPNTFGLVEFEMENARAGVEDEPPADFGKFDAKGDGRN